MTCQLGLLFSLTILGIFVTNITGKEVTILDTRNATSDLNWPTSGYGWTEVTSTDETEADLRTFQVCKIRQPGQNNWLRTPYLQAGSAQRIYVEIRFTIRSCEGMSRIVSCKETFNLYYLPSNFAYDVRASNFNEETYKKVDTIAADERFLPHSITANTETRIITPLDTTGLYIAFQDSGACMTVMHVRVYHKTCPETVRGLAWFRITNTGPEVTSLVDVKGICVENSVLMEHGPAPSLHCNGEGQWLVPSGNCQCKAGFQPNSDLTECNQCPVNKYKVYDGNGDCLACPTNSFSVGYGSTRCRCSSGYYKAPGDRPNAPCTKPPSRPTLAESVVNKTSVVVTWSEPRDKGGRIDITYSVSCEKCNSHYFQCTRCGDQVAFRPRKTRLTSGWLLLENLLPHTRYKIKIYSFSAVSTISRRSPKYAEIKFKTNEDAPSVVPPVVVAAVSSKEAFLRWDSPINNKDSFIEYQIQYSNGKNVRINTTKRTSFMLTRLTPSSSYIVQVRARSAGGYGLYSRPTAFRTKAGPGTASRFSFDQTALPSGITVKSNSTRDGATVTRPPSDNGHLVIAIVVACVLLVVTLAALLVICGRNNRRLKTSIVDLEKYPGFINNTVELINSRTYVDPSTYEDPYIAVQEFAKEIDYKLVRIEQVIGAGEFGEVCKGTLHPCHYSVAIKTLKAGYNSQEKLDFLGEASIMGQFDHPNVIRLEGVVTKSRPLMIITEYMENGSLDAYLRANEEKISTEMLTNILHCIAQGMQYLSGMGYIHRDLAARNILVNTNLECKVSDFGLSRYLEEVEDEQLAMYTTRGGMIPIRWTAPEAITNRTFSSCSDVWSFGIIIWEVLSFGERPYWEMSNQDVVHFVESGYRLPPPCYCPQVFHDVMLQCWDHDLTLRPTFNQLVCLLNHYIQEPLCLEETVNNRSLREQEDCIPEMLDISSLGQWLEQMHLLHYKQTMLRHGCITAEQIMRLTASELQRMGITDSNHINVILREANILRHKIEEVNNVGIAV